MCPVKDYFETLELKEFGMVILGNNKACKVQGIGQIRLRMFDNKEMLLHNVRYVPELKRNLMSISMFDVMGYSTKVEGGMMKVSSGASVIARGR